MAAQNKSQVRYRWSLAMMLYLYGRASRDGADPRHMCNIRLVKPAFTTNETASGLHSWRDINIYQIVLISSMLHKRSTCCAPAPLTRGSSILIVVTAKVTRVL